MQLMQPLEAPAGTVSTHTYSNAFLIRKLIIVVGLRGMCQLHDM
jgi:hypothetical protein